MDANTIANELVENLDYREVGSVVKARRCETLIMQLMVKRPASGSNSSTSQSFDMQALRDMLAEVRAYLLNAGERLSFADMSSNWRD